jgi:hypothetical protein
MVDIDGSAERDAADLAAIIGQAWADTRASWPDVLLTDLSVYEVTEE